MTQVSIIVPVYNVEAYVVACLQSVAEQSFRDFELIIIEDCSTDNSLQVVENWLAEQTATLSVSFIKQPHNQGLSEARNLGMSRAKGKYITFIDSDDYITPDYLEVLYSTIVTYQADIIALNNTSFYEEGAAQRHTPSYNHPEALVLVGEQILEHFVNHKLPLIQACSKLYSVDFLRKNDLLFEPGIYHEDILFSIQAFISAQKLVQLSHGGYMRRLRVGSITNHVSVKHIEDKFYIISKLRELLITNPSTSLSSFYNRMVNMQAMLLLANTVLPYKLLNKNISQWPQVVAPIKSTYLNKQAKLLVLLGKLPYPLVFIGYKSQVFRLLILLIKKLSWAFFSLKKLSLS